MNIFKEFLILYCLAVTINFCKADRSSIEDAIKRRTELLSKEKIPPLNYKIETLDRFRKSRLRKRSFPKIFDARKKWPYCSKFIDKVISQRNCPSTWAFSASALMTIRHCIEQGGRMDFMYSAQDLLECVPNRNNSTDRRDVCRMLHPVDALLYWTKSGVVSGGDYLSREGCKPITRSVALHGQVRKGCTKECNNIRFTSSYEEDKRRGKAMWRVYPTVLNIQYEIMNYGPVVAIFYTFEDYYKHFNDSIYIHKWGGWYGKTSVILFGWGEEHRIPFWYAMQFWGMETLKMNGIMRIIRGRNVGELEDSTYAVTTLENEELGRKGFDQYSSAFRTSPFITWTFCLYFYYFEK